MINHETRTSDQTTEPPRVFPTCRACGSILHERLAGELVCVRGSCGQAGQVVGHSGAAVGALGSTGAAS
jgi:hypothetical protein